MTLLKDKGEIEYFDFIPVNFVNELECGMYDIIQQFVQQHTIHGMLLHESCKKNMFIFKNFVLRNILCFPKTFTYDRKKTDLIVQEEYCFDMYNTVIHKQYNLLNEIQRIKNEIHKHKIVQYNYNKILEYENDLKETVINIKCIKDKYSRVLEYVTSLPFYEVTDNEFNNLLEYREIRSEVLKKEWKDICKRVDMRLLDE